MKTNLEISKENESKIIDLTVKFREAKELIESQAEEIEKLTKVINELKNK